MEETSNTSNVVGALITGVIIGGALGILFAPDKGSVTRKKLLSNREDLKAVLKDKLSELLAASDDNKKEEHDESNHSARHESL